jgi:hypothetical protein
VPDIESLSIEPSHTWFEEEVHRLLKRLEMWARVCLWKSVAYLCATIVQATHVISLSLCSDSVRPSNGAIWTWTGKWSMLRKAICSIIPVSWYVWSWKWFLFGSGQAHTKQRALTTWYCLFFSTGSG